MMLSGCRWSNRLPELIVLVDQTIDSGLFLSGKRVKRFPAISQINAAPGQNILYCAENADTTHFFHTIINLGLDTVRLRQIATGKQLIRLQKQRGKYIDRGSDRGVCTHHTCPDELFVKAVEEDFIGISTFHPL